MTGADELFQDLFNSKEFADADLVIMHGKRELRRLPGHRVLLCKRSEFLRAQGRNWQPQGATKRQTTAAASQDDSDSRRPLLSVTVDDPAHEDAALAVIAALYGVDANMRQLPQHMLVHAAVLADRLQAPAATATALDLLKAAAALPAGVSTATFEALAGLGAAWPRCLVPLLPALVTGSAWHKNSTGTAAAAAAAAAAKDPDSTKRMEQLLVCALGDLEQTFADQQLSSAFRELPLPAVRVLLASDQLTVVSEDTVLFAVQQYCQQLTGQARTEALTALADLVRCPQLSQFWLTALVAADDATGQAAGRARRALVHAFMLQHYGSSLKKMAQLVGLRRGNEAPQQFVAQAIPSAPAAWALGPRRIKAAAGVEWLWELPVSELKAACLSCAPDKKVVRLFSPRSPPTSGLAWRAEVQCVWEEDKGVRVGLFVGSVDPPPCVYFRFECEYEELVLGRKWPCCGRSEPLAGGQEGWGWADVFSVGAMSGGWDEVAWAAKGLPLEGSLRLKVSGLRLV